MFGVTEPTSQKTHVCPSLNHYHDDF